MSKRILITGSRKWDDSKGQLSKFINSLPADTIIIHGGASGVDRYAEQLCKGFGIKTVVIRPTRLDRRNYYLHRNAEMVGMADLVYAFWDGESRGTAFTINYARDRGKLAKIFYMEE